MPVQVVSGATLMCTFGTNPSNLVVLPANRVTCGNQPAANIMDHLPLQNIMFFGMCTSTANPAVAAATALASGVLTPQPCVPNTPGPWTTGAPTALIGMFPALDNASICNCVWAGVISVVSPGQTTTNIP